LIKYRTETAQNIDKTNTDIFHKDSFISIKWYLLFPYQVKKIIGNMNKNISFSKISIPNNGKINTKNINNEREKIGP
jgi:hypothetical protein